MRRVRPPLGLSCPGCGSGLEPLNDGPAEVHRLACPECGSTFRARLKSDPGPPATTPTVGGLNLAARGFVLRLIPPVYRAGVAAGSIVLLAAGGFIPVIRGWLDDRVLSLSDVVETVGGIRVVSESRDPDSDFGPVLRKLDAPPLFEEVAEVARRLGVRPPEEIRLAFLPCCGVVAWRRSRALLLGLPLLHVLTVGELRSILAHELAHLARGDATWAAGSLRFLEGIGRALDDPDGRSWGPLRLWAALCRDSARALIGPIARGQEARADRTAASIAGGSVTASALIKVALVQPLFREVLGVHDLDGDGNANVYAGFRALWSRLPEALLASMRLRLLTLDREAADSPHPPLPDRVAVVQAYPDRPETPSDIAAAASLVGDPDWLEQMLHDRLFGLPAIKPSVFHKAGS